ncbi:MAG: BRCT domain-containing protein [Candidatus Eremiobacterota bacterium]
MSYVARKSLTVPFTEGSNAVLRRQADRQGMATVSVEFGDGYQSDLVDLGWSERQADAVDEQLQARLPRGSSVSWEDREYFEISVPGNTTQDPVLDVAALLTHVRDNPLDPDAAERVVHPDRPARKATVSVPIPEDFRARFPHARAELDSAGQLSLSGAGHASREEVLALFRQLQPVAIPEQPEPPTPPADDFRFGEAGRLAAAAATAATAGPLAGMIFVFTGGLEGMTRAEASERVRSLGGRTASDVSQKTRYVVSGDRSGSKLDRARELGIPILDEQQFRGLTGL